MKIKVPNKPLRNALMWSQYGLFAFAAALLGYCAFVAVDTYLFQDRESRAFTRLLAERRVADGGSGEAAFHTPRVPEAVPMSGVIGRIEIARLGVSVMVKEGDDGKTLRRAAGHVPGTALPGQPGNVAVTAHRDTFFRPLRNIQMNDVVTLATLQGEYRYRVVSTKIVSPEDVSVLDPTGHETLTLVTCHPFYFVGNAPNRFIVHADRVMEPIAPASEAHQANPGKGSHQQLDHAQL
jgi:sortase A